jgi:hypothetical protein
MLALTRRREIVYDKGKPVEVIRLSGDSNYTVSLVVSMMKGVKLGHAGLGGTNAHNIKADAPKFWDSDVAGRIRDHGGSEFRYHQLLSAFIVNNNDQATVLRELGNKFRHEHKLCRIPANESDFVVALEREGLSSGTFSNVNSYGANVVSKLLPQASVEDVTLALRSP